MSRVRVVGNHLVDDSLELKFDSEDQISKYLERMQQNKNKSSLEIMAGIE